MSVYIIFLSITLNEANKIDFSSTFRYHAIQFIYFDHSHTGIYVIRKTNELRSTQKHMPSICQDFFSYIYFNLGLLSN